MISNYHTASGSPASDHYYTMYDNDDVPSSTSKNAGAGAAATGKKSIGKKRGIRGRLFGRKSRGNSVDTVSDMSQGGGGSLGYSTSSSVQSTGESTDASSHFSGILKVLEAQDQKELLSLSSTHNRYRSNSAASSAGHSAASLQYSDSDTSYTGRSRMSRDGGGSSSQRSVSSFDYSTDADSHLEGSKLIQMLLDE